MRISVRSAPEAIELRRLEPASLQESRPERVSSKAELRQGKLGLDVEGRGFREGVEKVRAIGLVASGEALRDADSHEPIHPKGFDVDADEGPVLSAHEVLGDGVGVVPSDQDLGRCQRSDGGGDVVATGGLDYPYFGQEVEVPEDVFADRRLGDLRASGAALMDPREEVGKAVCCLAVDSGEQAAFDELDEQLIVEARVKAGEDPGAVEVPEGVRHLSSGPTVTAAYALERLAPDPNPVHPMAVHEALRDEPQPELAEPPGQPVERPL